MPTYYKPTIWRGQRVVYKSIDPNEPKTEMMKFIVFVTVAIALLAGSFFMLR